MEDRKYRRYPEEFWTPLPIAPIRDLGEEYRTNLRLYGYKQAKLKEGF
jgi:hypothetical protein